MILRSVQNVAKISMNIEPQSAIDWGQEFREKTSVWQLLTLRKAEIADPQRHRRSFTRQFDGQDMYSRTIVHNPKRLALIDGPEFARFTKSAAPAQAL